MVTVAAIIAGTLSACGGSGPSGSRASSSTSVTTYLPPPVTNVATQWPCLQGQHATLRTIRKRQLPVAELGHGSHLVVLSEQSDQDLCSWLPLARELVANGFAVAMYDYTGDPVADLEAVVRLERSRGARTVAVMGASEGAKASIVAASTLHPQPNAVVSLSAEAALQEYAVAPYAQRVTAPTLLATASNDPYGSDEVDPGFYRSEPAKIKQLLVVPGTAHGTALLVNPTVHRAVLSFLTAHDT